ncbi:YciI family protein [Pelagibacterium sp.]|uniref:YciI family protein n=1 Tax=Pelagibacterium sp. TaxID=1967288 RepID=UPI003A91A38C
MLFIVSGRDKPAGIGARLEFRARHRAHYASLGDDLVLAGPYLGADGEPIGSMIVIRAVDQQAADKFARADPYWTEGVFESLDVSRWDWFMKRPDALLS